MFDLAVLNGINGVWTHTVQNVMLRLFHNALSISDYGENKPVRLVEVLWYQEFIIGTSGNDKKDKHT
jgi:hypothetical protein